MNYKHKIFALFCTVVIFASGCSNTAMLKGEQQAEDMPTQVAEASAEQVDVEQAPVLTAEEQRLLATQTFIQSSTNRYANSQKANSPQARALLLEALAAKQQAQNEVAMSLINSVKALSEPLNSAAYVLMGDIYLANENANEAARYFDLALSTNPNNFKAANRRALLHREAGEFDQAYSLYTQALASNPVHAPSYRNRGVLQDLYLGDKAAALQDYQMYADLIAYQQSLNEDNQEHGGMLTSFSNDELKRESRRVRGWLIDVERQLASQNTSMARQSNESE